MICVICKNHIPAERIEALPHATTCVSCSIEKKNLAVTVYPHKTGGYVEVVRANNQENIRIAERYNRRAR